MARIDPDILGRLFDEHAVPWCFLLGNGATLLKISFRMRLSPWQDKGSGARSNGTLVVPRGAEPGDRRAPASPSPKPA